MNSGPIWIPLLGGLGMKLRTCGMGKAYAVLAGSGPATGQASPSRYDAAPAAGVAPLACGNMTRRSEWLTAELEDYVLAHSTRADDLLAQLVAETAASWPDAAGMQIGPEQGTFMTM